MDDTFYTIAQVSEAVHKQKGSKFMAFAHHIESEPEARQLLDSYRKNAQFKGACHFCYAYSLGFTNKITKASDDGEPSGTAGKPILNQIESFKLSNIIVIVVRFFGGTLLGTSGLILAYKQASIDCLQQAVRQEIILRNPVKMEFDYKLQSEIDRVLVKYNIIFDKKLFEEKVSYLIQVKRNEQDNLIKQLEELPFYKQLNIQQ
ncbi:MAG: YigZ family protein [Bacteroidia bacterium]|nr:YigZ family protein [Bacteroidia bacterium]MCZ2248740.1 YigZ family protein [Bacteroidia bacterium]